MMQFTLNRKVEGVRLNKVDFKNKSERIINYKNLYFKKLSLV